MEPSNPLGRRMPHTPRPARLALATALALACAGVGGCGPEESRQRPPPDGSEQIRILVACLPQEACDRAVRELKTMGSAVVPQIGAALRDLSPNSDGSWLGEALFAFGEEAAAAGDTVFTRLVLGSNTAHVMASVLAVSGKDGQRLLVRALSPEHPEACLIAALIKVEADSEAAVRALGRLASHAKEDVRKASLRCLSESGELGRSLLPKIRKAFEDGVEYVRYAAMEAAAGVAAHGDSVTADALAARLLRETETSVMRAAIAALLSLEAATPAVRRALRHAAAKPDEWVSAEAASALTRLFPD